MTQAGIVRWDPKGRAGALKVKAREGIDLEAVRNLNGVIMDWARYTDLDGETDNVEVSSLRGTYDWRAYLQEETALARRREDRRAAERKPERPLPPPAPVHFYA